MDPPPTHGIAIAAAEVGSKNAVCQGPINQAKLPPTHTGRRRATPQAEAVYGRARDHSLARAGIMPTARSMEAKTQQTFTKTHASNLTKR